MLEWIPLGLKYRAGKSAAAVRYSALHAVYSLISLRRLEVKTLMPFLSAQGQLLPLLFQSMDEDWYQDTRKLACCSVAALLEFAGRGLTDDARRQIYPPRSLNPMHSQSVLLVDALQVILCQLLVPGPHIHTSQ